MSRSSIWVLSVTVRAPVSMGISTYFVQHFVALSGTSPFASNRAMTDWPKSAKWTQQQSERMEEKRATAKKEWDDRQSWKRQWVEEKGKGAYRPWKLRRSLLEQWHGTAKCQKESWEPQQDSPSLLEAETGRGKEERRAGEARGQEGRRVGGESTASKVRPRKSDGRSRSPTEQDADPGQLHAAAARHDGLGAPRRGAHSLGQSIGSLWISGFVGLWVWFECRRELWECVGECDGRVVSRRPG